MNYVSNLYIQIPPDKVFWYVLGVNIPSQEVFGCLGLHLNGKVFWNLSTSNILQPTSNN